MTVSPDINDATGEHIGFEAKEVKPFAQLVPDALSSLTDEELQDAMSPEQYEQYLQDVQQLSQEAEFVPFEQDQLTEILETSTVEEDTDIARAIINTEVPDNYVNNLVQVLTAQVYAGQLTVDQALAEAKATGTPMEELTNAFNNLYYYYTHKQ